MQVSPSGMAAASQAVPGEFDSRHLLQNKEHPSRVLLFLERLTPPKRFDFLAQNCGFPKTTRVEIFYNKNKLHGYSKNY